MESCIYMFVKLNNYTIDHFTFVPMNGSKAAGDLAFIQASLPHPCSYSPFNATNYSGSTNSNMFLEYNRN